MVPAASEGSKKEPKVALLAHPPGCGGSRDGELVSYAGGGEGVFRGQSRGVAWVFCTSLYLVLCAEGMLSCLAFAFDPLLLLQALQKWQLGFLASVSFVQNLSQLPPHTVISSPTQLHSILLLSERYVQGQALQHSHKGTQVPGLSHWKPLWNLVLKETCHMIQVEGQWWICDSILTVIKGASRDLVSGWAAAPHPRWALISPAFFLILLWLP